MLINHIRVDHETFCSNFFNQCGGLSLTLLVQPCQYEPPEDQEQVIQQNEDHFFCRDQRNIFQHMRKLNNAGRGNNPNHKEIWQIH